MGRTSSRTLALLVGAVGVTVVAWVAMRWDHSPSAGATDFRPDEVGVQASTSAVHDLTSATDGSRPSRTPSPRLTRIVNRGGAPISGARMLCVPSRPDFSAAAENWPDLDWIAVDAATAAMESDERGFVELPPAALDAARSGAVFWIAHVGYCVRSIRFGSGTDPQSVPDEIVLDESGTLRVEVTDATGRPAGGATIVQLADLRRVDRIEAARSDRAAECWLRMTWTTDSNGRAELPTLERGQVLFATQSGLESARWAGMAPAVVRLRLAPTFSFSARVTTNGGPTLTAPASVRWSAELADDIQLQDCFRVHEDGTVGPIALPCVPARQYLFQLEAPGCTLEQVVRAVPEPGAKVDVQFELNAGVDVSVRVTDETGLALADALVVGNWTLDGVWRKVERSTDTEGRARFRNAFPGSFWVRARKSGYVGTLLGPFDISTPPGEPLVIALQPAARIRGHVTHAGSPVRDFTIQYWKDKVSANNRCRVTDSADGAFAIEEAPVGVVTLLAMSDVAPSPAPMTVTTAPDAIAEVEIELPAGAVGRGRVVDAFTSEPLSNATIQLWCSTSENRVRPWRAPFKVSADGEFVIDGFAPGYTYCDVAAPGYATRNVTAKGAGGSQIELGWIGLVREQALSIELAPDAPADLSGYTAELRMVRFLGKRHFSADGRLRVERLEPGTWDLRIQAPDGTTLDDTVEVPAGGDARFVVPLGGRRVLVEVEFHGESRFVPGLMVRAFWRRPNGSTHVRTHDLEPEKPVEFSGIDAQHIDLSVSDASGIPLCVRSVSLDARGPETVRLVVGDDARAVRILDRARAPMSGATVFVTTRPNHTDWLAQLVTDGNGECHIDGYDIAPIYLAVYRASDGLMPSRPVELDPRQPTEIIFDARGEISIALRERDRPAAGVRVIAEDAQGVAWGLHEAFTDSEGIARWGPAGPGEYVVRVASPGWWPTRLEWNSATSPGTATLQVRRIASVEFEVKNNLGHAIPGVKVALASAELPEPLEELIRAGKVRVSDANLRTDAAGRIRFDGLPNGEFEWSAVSSTGESGAGRANAAPQAVARVVIELR